MRITLVSLSLLATPFLYAQNTLQIPPLIQSSNITLTLDEGTTEFYPGIVSNTMGANGALLGPTLMMTQGDNVSIIVDNQLEDSTTIHWHGMHVAPENDGGPHSVIPQNTQWNPQFTVLDKAGTHWYHPHLHMHTDMHVSKGIAGLIIVRDAEEAALNLPSTYGVDEIPLVLQTKGFDVNGQIIAHTNLDTMVLVNGTVHTETTLPAQVVRLRVLNGSSQRVMEFGFSDNRTFQLIGTDGGLLTAPLALTRYRLAPGQRIDVLLDLTGSLGQNFQLMSFGAELPNGNYGASQPGMGPGATSSLIGYTSNPLNGSNYALLDITVGAQTASPITSIPATLASFTPLQEIAANTTRNLTFTSSTAMNNLNGPFLINGASFNMMMINYTIPLDNIEIWSLTNQTPIAHPFHIHDVQFFILDINGVAPPAHMQGYNDVVLVPAGMGNVRFIAQFSDHTNDSIPYMYHCHMLQHEDEGMMGQFLVTDPNAGLEAITTTHWSVYPNPSEGSVHITSKDDTQFTVFDARGSLVRSFEVSANSALELRFESGVYVLRDHQGNATRVVIY
jgi:bilirubin oxidase